MRIRALPRLLPALLVVLFALPVLAGADDLRITRLPTLGLQSPDLVAEAYAAREGCPIWTTGHPAHARLGALMGELNRVRAEGLDPDDYHVSTLNRLTRRPEWSASDQELTRRDILLTDALLSLGRDLAGRRDDTDPDATIRDDARPDPSRVLAAVLENGAEPRPLLDALRPTHPAYAGLRDELARYRALAETGGWPTLPDGPPLAPGDVDDRVPRLRARLAAEGYGGVDGGDDPRVYDDELAGAVRYAQARCGLATDGVIGPATRAALDVPARERVAQIILNLERLRRLPRGGVEDRAVLVNIPAYTLEVVEGGRTVLSLRAIVGRTDRPTPVLSGELTWLEVHPYWNIPQKLARHDVLPRIRRDPDYLAERDIHVYESWAPGAPEVAPESIDWRNLDPWRLSYKLRQAPGPLNPLGQVKFMFSNAYSVYIHDTPSRGAFTATRRTFSSGCVRVEDPVALADCLLGDADPSADAAFHEAYAARTNRRVGLARPVPVHLMYLTAWTDGEGILHFRDDVYGYDAPATTQVAAQ